MKSYLHSANLAKKRGDLLAAAGLSKAIDKAKVDSGVVKKARKAISAKTQKPGKLLTPWASRIEFIEQGKPEYANLPLDKMLSDDEARALLDWSDCELILAGNATTVGEGCSANSRSTKSPVPDSWMKRVGIHALIYRHLRLDDRALQLLASYTAIQNQEECCQPIHSVARRFFPYSDDPYGAYLTALACIAKWLVNVEVEIIR